MIAAAWTITAACTACGACLRTCPARCLRPAPPTHPVPVIVGAGCTGCGECTEVCPVEAAIPLSEAASTGPARGAWR
ncbi:MAG: 4Fe-4S binding protein [Actinobacteria bacterium]|nr:4Fe-4S binding protein [Actinomycetota bacterium]